MGSKSRSREADQAGDSFGANSPWCLIAHPAHVGHGCLELVLCAARHGHILVYQKQTALLLFLSFLVLLLLSTGRVEMAPDLPAWVSNVLVTANFGLLLAGLFTLSWQSTTALQTTLAKLKTKRSEREKATSKPNEAFEKAVRREQEDREAI